MANVLQDELQLARGCRTEIANITAEFSGLLVFPRVWQDIEIGVIKPQFVASGESIWIQRKKINLPVMENYSCSGVLLMFGGGGTACTVQRTTVLAGVLNSAEKSADS